MARHLLLVATLLSTTVASAGSLESRTWGVRGGMASASLYSGGDSDARTGLVAGVWYRIEGPSFGVSLDVIYQRQGGNGILHARGYSSGWEAELQGYQDVELDYVQIPLLWHVKIDGTPLRMMAGPALGILVHNEVIDLPVEGGPIVHGLDDWFFPTLEGNLENPLGADISAWLGVGGETQVAGRTVGLAVHYQFGLRDIDQSARSVRNRVLMGSLTIGL